MKNNKFSIIIASIAILIAIATFFIACCKFEPLALANSSIEVVLTVIIGLLALAITVIIGVQIAYMLSTEKRFEERLKDAIENEKEEIKKDNDILQKDLRLYSKAIYFHSISTSNHYIKDYFWSFISKCKAIKCFTKINNKDNDINHEIDDTLKNMLHQIDIAQKDIIKGFNMANFSSDIIYLEYLLEDLLNIRTDNANTVYNFLKEIKLEEIIKNLKEEKAQHNEK